MSAARLRPPGRSPNHARSLPGRAGACPPMRKDSRMHRNRVLGFLFAAIVAAPAGAFAGTTVGWNVTIGNPPPPPPVVVFQREPRVVVVPGSTVYVIEDDCDYDVFRYGVFWYVYNDGYWFRARSHRGPFRMVNARYVPTAISSVPPKYWRHPHGGPPGQMKKRNDYVVVKEGNRRHKDKD